MFEANRLMTVFEAITRRRAVRADVVRKRLTVPVEDDRHVTCVAPGCTQSMLFAT